MPPSRGAVGARSLKQLLLAKPDVFSSWGYWDCGLNRRAFAALPQLEAKDDLPDQLPAELAAYITSRTIGIVQLRGELETALEQAVTSESQSAKSLRRAGKRLVTDLQQWSRSKARGGTQELSLDMQQQQQAQSRRLKPQKAHLALKKALKDLKHGAAMDLDVESNADLAAVQQSSDDMRPARRASPAYDASGNAAAYSVMRMPACYAVAVRVLRELRLARPDFVPTSLLDFGSGPGTAIWAAQEVWPDMLEHVTAVEPSQVMAGMARVIRESTPNLHPAPVRWHAALDARSAQQSSAGRRSGWGSGVRRQHDVTTAIYVLCEMHAMDRRRVVAALWRRTDHLLVIVEPGTPSGSATVRAARQQILDAEGPGRVHIVAPCPHEGRCPMDGTPTWCHFPQRFTRTRLQHSAKVLANGHAARDYQDERFSYVVLARGPRPAVAPALAATPIAPFLQDDPRLQKPFPRPAMLHSASAVKQKAAEIEPEPDIEGLDPAIRELMLQSIALGQDLDDDDDSGDGDFIHELEGLAIRFAEASSQSRSPSETGRSTDAKHASSSAHRGRQIEWQRGDPAWESDAASSSDLTLHEAGLTSQQSAEAGNLADSAALPPSNSPALPEAASAARTSHPASLTPAESRGFSPGRDDASASGADDSEGSDSEEALGQDEHWRAHHAELLAQAAEASSSWPRIVRQPRKRSRHVLVDVCAPCGGGSAAMSGSDAPSGGMHSQGRIVRQAVGAIDKQHWLGAAGYRLARKLRWGDLWPGLFFEQAITQK